MIWMGGTDMGNNPGKPTWGPYLTSQKAIEWESTLICVDPTAEAWDRAADARQAAWDSSIFAPSLDRLLS